MDYLDRYTHGEFEQVWSELQGLGEGVRQEPVYAQARLVADETMQRVRRNCERLVDRLRSLDYHFGVYPDGSTGYFTSGPLVPLGELSRSDMAALDKTIGPLPLSLASFWEIVGSVDFVGMRRGWPTGLDPLVVSGPEAVFSEVQEVEDIKNTYGHFEGSLAPDYLHKDNISGGAPYAVQLPDPHMDFLFRNEHHNLLFVPYLRFAILRWGGFPGLEGGAAEFNALPTLLQGLEPF